MGQLKKVFVLFAFLLFSISSEHSYATNVRWFAGYENRIRLDADSTVEIPSLKSEPQLFRQLMDLTGVSVDRVHDVSDFKSHLNQKGIAILVSEEDSNHVLGFAVVERRGRISVISDLTFRDPAAAAKGTKPLLLEMLRRCGLGSGVRFKDGNKGYFDETLNVTIREVLDLGFERTTTFPWYGDSYQNTPALSLVIAQDKFAQLNLELPSTEASNRVPEKSAMRCTLTWSRDAGSMGK